MLNIQINNSSDFRLFKTIWHLIMIVSLIDSSSLKVDETFFGNNVSETFRPFDPRPSSSYDRFNTRVSSHLLIYLCPLYDPLT